MQHRPTEHENLRRMGVDAEWLNKQLHVQGFSDAKDVFLGLCDAQQNLTLYPMNE